jgi:hypothetical protein
MAWTRETADVESSRPLRERSLEQLLWQVLAQKCEGLVMLRDRDGLRHGVWAHGGFVVGVHVAGRFDPLLDILRRDGVLNPAAYQACVEALWRSPARSGAIAVELAGIGRALVRDALKTQATERMRCLLEIAESRGHDARFEACDVPAAELSVRIPLGSLLRAATSPTAFHAGAHDAAWRGGAQPDGHDAQQPPPACSPEAARRRLRELARTLHPDCNGHLDPVQRKALEREMAAATAAYHGFV